MILVISDLHLGKHPEWDDEILHDLAICVEANGPETVLFLGDVFDAFIEGSGYTPDPVVKWVHAVESWIKQGTHVRYVMGNHDRWHRSLVRDVTGSAPVRDPILLDFGATRVHLEHGDRAESHGLLTRVGRWLSDQHLVYRTYAGLLPFGGAQRLAASVSRRAASFEANPDTISSLEQHADDVLSSDSVHGVVMGHSHVPTLNSGEHGWYMNTGDWYLGRTFGLIDVEGAKLCRWDGQVTRLLNSVRFE